MQTNGRRHYQSIYLANCATTKNECQQYNVKHSDGLTGYQKSKSLISAGRPNKYKALHKIVRDRQKQRQTDRQTCSDKFYHKLQIKPI